MKPSENPEKALEELVLKCGWCQQGGFSDCYLVKVVDVNWTYISGTSGGRIQNKEIMHLCIKCLVKEVIQ